MDKDLENEIRSLTRSNFRVFLYAALIAAGCIGAVLGSLYLAYLITAAV